MADIRPVARVGFLRKPCASLDKKFEAVRLKVEAKIFQLDSSLETKMKPTLIGLLISFLFFLFFGVRVEIDTLKGKYFSFNFHAMMTSLFALFLFAIFLI